MANQYIREFPIEVEEFDPATIQAEIDELKDGALEFSDPNSDGNIVISLKNT